MLVTLTVIFVLASVTAFVVARQYRATITPFWRPGLTIWRSLRLLAFLLIAYGLFVSGSTALQTTAVLMFAFFGIYLAIERPYENYL